MEEHPNGRCTMAPWVATWEELGFSGIEETAPVIEDGATAFDKLTDDKQLKVLGPAKYTAYKNGELTLSDLVGRKTSARWGTMRYEKSLRELGLDRSVLLKQYEKDPIKGMVNIEDAINQISNIHGKTDGSTFSLYHGNMAGQPYYSVSIFPDLSKTIIGKQITIDDLKKFIKPYEGLARNKNIGIGTWYNPDENKTYLDFVTLVSDEKVAIDLGKRYNQIGLFNLGKMEYIETGGTGESIDPLPSLLDRLRGLE